MMTPSATINAACVNASNDAGQSSNIQSKSGAHRSSGFTELLGVLVPFQRPPLVPNISEIMVRRDDLQTGQPLSRIAGMSLTFQPFVKKWTPAPPLLVLGASRWHEPGDRDSAMRTLSLFRKRRSEIDNRGGLGAATFLSRYREDHDAP